MRGGPMNWYVIAAVVFLASAVYAVFIGDWVAVVALSAAGGVYLNMSDIAELKREIRRRERLR